MNSFPKPKNTGYTGTEMIVNLAVLFTTYEDCRLPPKIYSPFLLLHLLLSFSFISSSSSPSVKRPWVWDWGEDLMHGQLLSYN